ncbi:MAG TPA: DUF4235 domain-containing protein [Solirubrobacterales bacterium]|jgi:hypothetical protein|nr:DUF4235 domain-containing protein [Solirubrobacterales bacterium]
MKLVFTPLSIVLGLVAGMVGKKIFERLWGLVDEEEPPRPEHREFAWPKLIAALVFEGAIFRLVKGLVDHGARRSFAKATGSWPGEESPESA